MRALSIRQPWAELILRRRKTLELRSWRTHYRGPVLIHASGKVDWHEAEELGLNPDKLQTGAFVGVAHLVGVRPFTKKDWQMLKRRRACVGKWQAGLFAWELKRVRRIRPIPAKGRLRLFRVASRLRKRIELKGNWSTSEVRKG